jgi:hypothetical protein
MRTRPRWAALVPLAHALAHAPRRAHWRPSYAAAGAPRRASGAAVVATIVALGAGLAVCDARGDAPDGPGARVLGAVALW